MGSCISWLTDRAAASRRPPNREGSGARNRLAAPFVLRCSVPPV